jgi:hypothetical protein
MERAGNVVVRGNLSRWRRSLKVRYIADISAMRRKRGTYELDQSAPS